MYSWRGSEKEDSHSSLMPSQKIVSHEHWSPIFSVACVWPQRRGKKFAAAEPRRDPIPRVVQPCAPGTVPFPEERGRVGVCARVPDWKRKKHRELKDTLRAVVPAAESVSSNCPSRQAFGARVHRLESYKTSCANRYRTVPSKDETNRQSIVRSSERFVLMLIKLNIDRRM